MQSLKDILRMRTYTCSQSSCAALYLCVGVKISLFYPKKTSLSLDFVLTKNYHFYCYRTKTCKEEQGVCENVWNQAHLVCAVDGGQDAGPGSLALS